MKTYFKLEDRSDENGVVVPTLVKYVEQNEGETSAGEEWCNVQDLNRMFDSQQFVSVTSINQ